MRTLDQATGTWTGEEDVEREPVPPGTRSVELQRVADGIGKELGEDPARVLAIITSRAAESIAEDFGGQQWVRVGELESLLKLVRRVCDARA